MERLKERWTHELVDDRCLRFGPNDDALVRVSVESAIVVMVHSPSGGTVIASYRSPKTPAANCEEIMLPADFSALIDLIHSDVAKGVYGQKDTKIFLGGGSSRRTLSPDYRRMIDENFQYALGRLQETGIQQIECSRLQPDCNGEYVFQTGPGTVTVTTEEF